MKKRKPGNTGEVGQAIHTDPGSGGGRNTKLILRKFLCSAAAMAISLAIIYNSGESVWTCLIGAEVMYLSGYVGLVEILDLIRERRKQR